MVKRERTRSRQTDVFIRYTLYNVRGDDGSIQWNPSEVPVWGARHLKLIHGDPAVRVMCHGKQRCVVSHIKTMYLWWEAKSPAL